MEWARSITVSEGRLRAEISSTDELVRQFPLSELYRRGLPSPKSTVRRSRPLKLDFGSFSTCNAREYTEHFAFALPGGSTGCHHVFEVTRGRNRYLVPALALMRALFKPTSRLLSLMFTPNALERTCWLDYSELVTRLVVDANWATSGYARRCSDWNEPLRWLMAHPSARRMADSVHAYAMCGTIGIDLPKGEVELVFAGVQRQSTVVVTEVRILAVVPADQSDLPVAGLGPKIKFLDVERPNPREVVTVEVPTHADGRVDLTNEEWLVIGPILEGQRERARPYTLCQRALFDGVLRKLATGKTWHECHYKVGDWRNAATAYNTWRMRGAFNHALDVLRAMR